MKFEEMEEMQLVLQFPMGQDPETVQVPASPSFTVALLQPFSGLLEVFHRLSRYAP
jgi:hypothetical protein